ncbi:MAG: flagellar basal body L-ring protein FlgH [Pseudomonadota bacterium]
MKVNHVLNIMGVLVLLTSSLGVSGCLLSTPTNGAGLVAPQDLPTDPVLQPQFSLPRAAEGSLWDNKSRSLFEDSTAARVGDTVIIDIIENTSSSMDVNTETTRKTAMDIGLPTINLLGNKKIFGAGVGETKLLGTDFTNSMTGEGKSDRSGQVTASIAARITEVLPNGNLSIFGRRAMKVNNEVQYITVSGVVRPQDISSTNRVKSTYLADSRIEYYGKGALADKQEPGWGTRIIDNLWPW